MTEIIPGINVDTFEEVKNRIEKVAPYVSWVHIDVADGSFTSRAVWYRSEDLARFTTSVKVEIHFMMQDPDTRLSQWFLPAVSRLIFHYETAKDPDAIITACHHVGKEAAVSICPETTLEVLKPFIRSADMLQILAVHPGPSGQVFEERMLEKIKALRAFDQKIPIEVDGGIKPGVARACKEAGANIFVAGSALFGERVSFLEVLRALRNDVS